MAEKKETYIAQYHDQSRAGEWNQPGRECPRYKFKARDDKEALDIALSFARKPTMYFAGARRRGPIPNAVYTLMNLYRLTEVEITRRSPRKTLKVCLGKEDFDFFT